LKKYLFSQLVLAVCLSTTSYADSDLSTQELLAIAKISGACGILQSMSAFQNSTQMSGGDEFLIRYWSTEAARVGKTPDQYILECNQYIDLYEKLWTASEENQ